MFGIHITVDDVNKREISAQDFFRTLSAKESLILPGHSFNDQFFVEQKQMGWDTVFKVSLATERSRFNPLRFFEKKLTERDKVKNSQNLRYLVQSEKKKIVSDPLCNIGRISAVFTRIAEKTSEKMSPRMGQLLRENFAYAVEELKNAKIEYEVKKNEDPKEQGFKANQQVLYTNFYEDLANFSSKKRFHIFEPAEGDFQIYYSNKPSCFSKLYSWKPFAQWESLNPRKELKPAAVSDAAKITTAQKLNKMIKTDKRILLSYAPYQIRGMIETLQRIKGRIVKNTSPQSQKKIESGFNGAILRLKFIHEMVRKERGGPSFREWFWDRITAGMYSLAGAIGSKTLDVSASIVVGTMDIGVDLGAGVFDASMSAGKYTGTKLFHLARATCRLSYRAMQEIKNQIK